MLVIILNSPMNIAIEQCKSYQYNNLLSNKSKSAIMSSSFSIVFWSSLQKTVLYRNLNTNSILLIKSIIIILFSRLHVRMWLGLLIYSLVNFMLEMLIQLITSQGAEIRYDLIPVERYGTGDKPSTLGRNQIILHFKIKT